MVNKNLFWYASNALEAELLGLLHGARLAWEEGFRKLWFETDSTMASKLVFKGGKKCPPSLNCGDLGKIHFPFTNSELPDCGLVVIHGCDENYPDAKKSIKNNEIWYDVLTLGPGPFTITIRDDDLHDLLLSKECKVFTYDQFPFSKPSLFASFYIRYNITLFKCNQTLHITPPTSFSNFTICSEEFFFQNSDSDDSDEFLSFFSSCSRIQLPITNTTDALKPSLTNIRDPFDFLLSADISIEIKLSTDCSSCYYVQGGQCQIDSKGRFYCAKAVSASGALVILMILAFFLRRRYCNKDNPSHQIIEKFLEEHGHLAAKRYSYLEVKKVTNSFRNKLGQGGFGSVYKGKLSDGSLVAVKVLSDLEGDGEEFINEVASISVTSHINIVSLLGFCLETSKRALIYEYMPNGSLEKYIYEEKDSSKLNLQLSCEAMYNIAIGVARGLEYLHRGCNTRILHFDIKPHNILLDEDFCPKISDFGLAKICPRKDSWKDSIISLLGARGTAGYIAPEVFSRNFGGVSHKSDVYSYGMMVLEMVGGRRNNNVTDEEYSGEIFMPHWVHKRLKSNQELTLRCIRDKSDEEIVKKIVTVSLWCIQIDPSNRPAMSKVVDMMEGSLESLELPPLPVLSSPSSSPSHQTLKNLSSSGFTDSSDQSAMYDHLR
ncbi:LEAF RUST 10 DISEASE-RESISTANCE LOCUS RECEPTOR-LIKE PROTEIN KINASE-like 2.1 [Senna tora]|uniref:LEAF RUST 10 DISEASE-RESISTANCE LOCUS RECEPTOR-LIKE PROTEIN KINASE-like 2.1 n=1 Tax=Senna tora TaxID=362788 RepID=A0A834T3T6_9FABA|nr:LEAF RUST 10 DISEASE-RESISTANCE LOCUS RECEPTOR-LIKE PROTEIN KINASE-like 2.1 [Senna tora]